jgi:hypothetical protein
MTTLSTGYDIDEIKTMYFGESPLNGVNGIYHKGMEKLTPDMVMYVDLANKVEETYGAFIKEMYPDLMEYVYNNMRPNSLDSNVGSIYPYDRVNLAAQDYNVNTTLDYSKIDTISELVQYLGGEVSPKDGHIKFANASFQSGHDYKADLELFRDILGNAMEAGILRPTYAEKNDKLNLNNPDGSDDVNAYYNHYYNEVDELIKPEELKFVEMPKSLSGLGLDPNKYEFATYNPFNSKEAFVGGDPIIMAIEKDPATGEIKLNDKGEPTIRYFYQWADSFDTATQALDMKGVEINNTSWDGKFTFSLATANLSDSAKADLVAFSLTNSTEAYATKCNDLQEAADRAGYELVGHYKAAVPEEKDDDDNVTTPAKPACIVKEDGTEIAWNGGTGYAFLKQPNADGTISSAPVDGTSLYQYNGDANNPSMQGRSAVKNSIQESWFSITTPERDIKAVAYGNNADNTPKKYADLTADQKTEVDSQLTSEKLTQIKTAANNAAEALNPKDNPSATAADTEKYLAAKEMADDINAKTTLAAAKTERDKADGSKAAFESALTSAQDALNVLVSGAKAKMDQINTPGNFEKVTFAVKNKNVLSGNNLTFNPNGKYDANWSWSYNAWDTLFAEEPDNATRWGKSGGWFNNAYRQVTVTEDIGNYGRKDGLEHSNGSSVGQVLASSGIGVGAGVAAGAAIGSVVPGLGTAAGAIIGGMIGFASGLIAGAFNNWQKVESSNLSGERQGPLVPWQGAIPGLITNDDGTTREKTYKIIPEYKDGKLILNDPEGEPGGRNEIFYEELKKMLEEFSLDFLPAKQMNLSEMRNQKLLAYPLPATHPAKALEEAYIKATKDLSEFLYGNRNACEDGIGMCDVDNLRRWFDNKTYPQNQTVRNVIDGSILERIFDTYGEPKQCWVDANGNDCTKEAQWYTNLFNRMRDGYKALEDGLANDPKWIDYALKSGLAVMEQVDGTNAWNALTYTNCVDITEQRDTTSVAIAEAEYSREMSKIQAKDKRCDVELKQIDTEHNSLQVEYDSIKAAIDKNMERTLKIYSA